MGILGCASPRNNRRLEQEGQEREVGLGDGPRKRRQTGRPRFGSSSSNKTLLKLTILRIKLLRNRREIQIKQMRGDIAKPLETGQEATPRIRVEHIIREENMMAAQEIIELFCELIAVRLPIIETQSGDGGRSTSSASFFVGGGIVVGTLGCIYAPQKQRKILAEKNDQLNSAIDVVSSQLRADDPPNGVANTLDGIIESRKILAEKNDQLNSAIDDASSQLRADEPPNGVANTRGD